MDEHCLFEVFRVPSARAKFDRGVIECISLLWDALVFRHNRAQIVVYGLCHGCFFTFLGREATSSDELSLLHSLNRSGTRFQLILIHRHSEGGRRWKQVLYMERPSWNGIRHVSVQDSGFIGLVTEGDGSFLDVFIQLDLLNGHWGGTTDFSHALQCVFRVVFSRDFGAESALRTESCDLVLVIVVICLISRWEIFNWTFASLTFLLRLFLLLEAASNHGATFFVLNFLLFWLASVVQDFGQDDCLLRTWHDSSVRLRWIPVLLHSLGSLSRMKVN